jgi:type IV pilus assembly protein PilM
MQKIIGLDIGSYSIKAVEIINSFKTYEIVNFYEKVIPTDSELSNEELLPLCMEQLFRENNLVADRIIAAMPGQYISSRVMPFGFSDAKKIRESIYGEVEDRVPFDLEDMIVDHQILGTSAGSTMVLVVMTRKNFLQTFLEHLERININPKLVDVDSLALYNLTSFLKIEPSQVAAIVDVGHEKTSVCIVQDGILRMFRSIKHGGKAITEFLSRDLEVGYNEAQEVKHRVSRVVWRDEDPLGLSEADLRIARRIGLSANAIVKELGRTFYAFKTWEKTPITKIFISGGTAKIIGFDEYFADQLGVEVEKSGLFDTNLQIDDSLRAHKEIIPQSVSIGLRAVTGVKRHSQINLRKGEFAYSQDYEALLKVTTGILKYLSVGILLVTFSYISQYVFYKSQINGLQEEFVKDYVKQIPDAKKKLSGKSISASGGFAKIRSQAFDRMHSDINQRRKALGDFQQAAAGAGALIALKDISTTLPKTIKLEVTSYEYNINPDLSGRVVLKGETDGFGTMSQIIEALKKNPSFQEVKEKSSGAKPGTDNKTIEFNIQFVYVAKSGGKA